MSLLVDVEKTQGACKITMNNSWKLCPKVTCREKLLRQIEWEIAQPASQRSSNIRNVPGDACVRISSSCKCPEFALIYSLTQMGYKLSRPEKFKRPISTFALHPSPLHSRLPIYFISKRNCRKTFCITQRLLFLSILDNQPAEGGSIKMFPLLHLFSNPVVVMVAGRKRIRQE